ncbi:MAG: universal stress protein [Chloroflexi bacterium]|nr:MAG: universal stress protein [Chloroflexota bacterium]MBL1197362.1 universal stress protein [Chloroflexota bacterium]NOH14659.1 universal stress protein [Chloroflexota bacterium]
MAHVSHKLKNSLEGALAGGGDPATSPLYVFGPFLRLIVVAGVAQITFGASVWMVVLTIAVVSAMYRLVMQWVTDGSGGSGLSEEEFGGWAVKVNAAITFVEYTLTFLVSMAAMVTFIADRLPVLNEHILWIQYRTIVAILLSVLVGWLVNRGPRIAARAFGPATAGVLLLLWAMVIATIVQQGFHLPDFNLAAFNFDNLGFTIGGYVRILAVMTGIEVFANLVAAYSGTEREKSSKAFRSLLIIMGTTGITMLIVGPAILNIADPTLEEVSVFTQTMDQLLPAPLPLLGTLVGIAVLMSASAAASQGIQNLALGLKERQYIPPLLGMQNEYEVADKPVWIQVAIVAVAYLFFGTDEETYLAIYAAGVFILLSMTGWAVMKRLLRELRQDFSIGKVALITGTALAAILTTTATVIIFEERFLEGAWTYFVFIPILYAFFTYFRNRLGEPTAEMEALGQFNMGQLGGFGFGQNTVPSSNGNGTEVEITWQPEPIEESRWREERVVIDHIAVLLDGSTNAAQALPAAQLVAKTSNAKLTLLSSIKDHTDELKESFEATRQEREQYLKGVADEVKESGIAVEYTVRPGFIADATQSLVDEQGVDLIVTTTRGKSGEAHWARGGASRKLVQKVATPLLLVHAVDEQLNGKLPKIDNILIALDGSIYSEAVLPYARAFAKAFNSQLTLLSVPAVPDTRSYRAASDAVQQLRERAEVNMKEFLDAVAKSLREDGIEVNTIVTGDMPARTIVTTSEEVDADLVMMTSRGRGGVELLLMGSVAERVVQQTANPVFMVPVQERQD